jgi:hypothetical protein
MESVRQHSSAAACAQIRATGGLPVALAAWIGPQRIK